MPVTDAMIDAAWAAEVEPLAQLVEISSEGLTEPIRVSDCPDRLLSGRKAGIVSEGEEYPYFPFRLTWASATREQPFGAGRLIIANVDSRIEAAIEELEEPPTVSLRLVRVADPDIVETAIEDAQIGQSDFTEIEVSAVIRPRTFDTEPAVAAAYTPHRAPGLH